MRQGPRARVRESGDRGSLLVRDVTIDLRIFTEPQQGATYDDLLRVARAAEDLGFGGFFRSDHYLHMSGDGGSGPTDAWTTLAGLARDTSTIRLGTLVTSATFRLPGPLAVQVAGVDQMSGGRVELGLGAGWFEQEHRAYGIPFPALGERFDRLEEQLAVITGLWSTPPGETFSHQGSHYPVVDSPALAKPVQDGGVPIIVGGAGKRRTPALAARYAAEFNAAFQSASASGELFERVRAACAAIGRDGDAPVYSAAQVVVLGEDAATLRRRSAAIGREVDELRTNGLAGSADEIVDRIGAFAEVGASRLYLQVLDLSDLDHLEEIAHRVQTQL
ncbi:putative F420-dependent oxidoreductase [Intrasporangium calvum DSM 43043]|uniref:F420-dependent oxidoreductase n=1 Tax=Intrasporangium calvum (strain ATCC 23552 / DSM 43043 / JCM 3097 / NBRC 12989 / NCIMB 10167 / NRRL B-3866 / 7 KIP) TaxID=710696 RepID=E6S9U2_INTC7|nr:putative F420-dependent oxidoreductase [Intrasporangium calvum DSM 43043]